MDKPEPNLLFDVMTPLGFRVHCSEIYWQSKIVTQHPILANRVEDVKETLQSPDEIRLSRIDEEVYLFYRADEKRFVCAVARSMESDGFLITAYPTDKLKRGKTVWTR